MGINAKTINVKEFLEKNTEKYKIPVFQRNYSWTKENCNQLLKDIFKTQKKDYKHFIGNIILQTIYDNDNRLSGRFENIIVDGQQRITTIFLLIKALLDISKDIDKNEENIRLLKSFIYFDKSNEKKLKLNIDDNIDYSNLLEDKFSEIKADSQILINYLYFKGELIQAINKENLNISDFIELFSKLIFIIIFLDPNDDSQIIFERINSTGLGLSVADLIRNYLLMSNWDQDMLYKNYWLKIEKKLGIKNIKSFINHYLIYKTSENISSEKIYDHFKIEFKKNNWDKKEILKDMLNICDIYSIILQINCDSEEQINKLLNDLKIINQTTCYPFIINVFIDYKNKLINKDTLIKTLTTIRNYLFRRAITEKIANKNYNKFFARLYNNIFEIDDNKKNYFYSIESYFKQITTNDKFPKDTEFKLALQNNNIYSINRGSICKFLLLEIENYNSKEKVLSKNLTIEHIMPQSKSEEWVLEIGIDKYDDIKEKYLNTIGNLTLTGYNSHLSNYAFTKKKEKLSMFNSKLTRLNEDILNKDVWNEKSIIDRSNKLIEITTKIFNYPN